MSSEETLRDGEGTQRIAKGARTPRCFASSESILPPIFGCFIAICTSFGTSSSDAAVGLVVGGVAGLLFVSFLSAAVLASAWDTKLRMTAAWRVTAAWLVIALAGLTYARRSLRAPPPFANLMQLLQRGAWRPLKGRRREERTLRSRDLSAGCRFAARGLSGCSYGVLNPQGPVGANEKLILADATAIMLSVVIPVIVCTLVFAWWFRARNPRARRRPDWEYSGRIEFVTWCIPALIVLFLSGIAWIGSHDLDPPKPLAAPATPSKSR